MIAVYLCCIILHLISSSCLYRCYKLLPVIFHLQTNVGRFTCIQFLNVLRTATNFVALSLLIFFQLTVDDVVFSHRKRSITNTKKLIWVKRIKFHLPLQQKRTFQFNTQKWNAMTYCISMTPYVQINQSTCQPVSTQAAARVGDVGLGLGLGDIQLLLTETISAMQRLVLPLSSRIVIGLSSRILSNAAGQFIWWQNR